MTDFSKVIEAYKEINAVMREQSRAIYVEIITQNAAFFEKNPHIVEKAFTEGAKTDIEEILAGEEQLELPLPKPEAKKAAVSKKEKVEQVEEVSVEEVVEKPKKLVKPKNTVAAAQKLISSIFVDLPSEIDEMARKKLDSLFKIYNATKASEVEPEMFDEFFAALEIVKGEVAQKLADLPPKVSLEEYKDKVLAFRAKGPAFAEQIKVMCEKFGADKPGKIAEEDYAAAIKFMEDFEANEEDF
jgi:hypothetical protein